VLDRTVTALADPELYLTLWLHRMLVTTAAASSSVQGYLVLSRNSSQRVQGSSIQELSIEQHTSKKRMAAAGVLSGHTAHQQAVRCRQRKRLASKCQTC
jgi:hypothetical protein